MFFDAQARNWFNCVQINLIINFNFYHNRTGQHGQQSEQELATKMLQIQSKRFYLDVKQNRRGRFIKVAEVNVRTTIIYSMTVPILNVYFFFILHTSAEQIGADGRRSQIFLALSTAAEFRDHLSTFSDYYSSLGKFF